MKLHTVTLTKSPSGFDDIDVDTRTHIQGTALSGLHTLCGYCDLNGFVDSEKPVDCSLCLAIFDYCKAGTVRRGKAR